MCTKLRISIIPPSYIEAVVTYKRKNKRSGLRKMGGS